MTTAAPLILKNATMTRPPSIPCSRPRSSQSNVRALKSAAIAVPSARPRNPITFTRKMFRIRFTETDATETITGVRLLPSE
jgi:hypothetical protein